MERAKVCNQKLFLGKIFAFILDLLQCPGMGILDTQKMKEMA
jgi:hypothetical protein